jgi:hypothetical protein
VGDQVQGSGNLQIVTTAGVAALTAPTWPPAIGGTVPDGTVVWQRTATGYGGQATGSILGGTLMTTAAGGTSGLAEPAWTTTVGQQPVDGAITDWQMSQPSGTSAGTDLQNIMNALNACPAQGVVQLTAGIYYITSSLVYGSRSAVLSQVTLRGKGPDQTKLIASGSATLDSAGGAVLMNWTPANTNYYQGDVQWTGGYAKGSTLLTLASMPPALTAVFPSPLGNVVHLDQRDDSVGICPATGGVGICSGVAGASESGTTVTIVTTLPHGYTATQSVGIGLVTGGNAASIRYNTSGISPAWAANTVYPTGSLVNGASATMEATTGGTSGAAAPTWPPVIGNTVADNTVTWTRRGGGSYANYYCSATVSTGTNSNQTNCPWWTITDVGCVISGSYVTASGCGITPINAFQYTAPISGLPNAGSPSATSSPWTTVGVSSAMATVDTGGVYKVSIVNVTNPTAAAVGRVCPGTNSGGPGVLHCPTAAEMSRRSLLETHQITAVCTGAGVGNTAAGNGVSVPACQNNLQVVVWPPLLASSWRASQDPRMWWMTKAARLGIEDLTLDMSPMIANGNLGGISFQNCFECWVRNVRSIYSNRNHVGMNYGGNDEVRDNYIFGSQGRRNTAYGVELGAAASFAKVENNICQKINGCILAGASMGSVAAYNYGMTSTYDGGPVWNLALMIGTHNSSGFGLFEGNVFNATSFDATHTTASQLTAFRNRLYGYDFPPRVNTGSLTLANVDPISRGYNFIGNVLGWPGIQTSYEGTARGQASIWVRAFPVGPTRDDQLTRDMMLRWGNYDTINQATQWNVADVPSTPPAGGWAFINANPVPPQTLPASFYLTAQPAYWTTPYGTPGWPAIGPDVTASGTLDATCATPWNQTTGQGDPFRCNGVAHLSYQIPAQMCIANAQPDPAYAVPGWPITTSTYTAVGGNTATFTTAASGALLPADTVNVSGVSLAEYNRDYVVCTVNVQSGNYCPGTITTGQVNMQPLQSPGGTGASGTGGTMTLYTVKSFNGRTCYPNDFGAAPPGASLSVSPLSIAVGGSATLSWTTGGATQASIDQGIGTVALPSGSMPVSPTVTTTYTLTATNANGTSTATATLTVGTTPPPTALKQIVGPGRIVGTGVIKP